MSKLILEFDRIEDREEMEMAISAGKMHSALWDYSQKLRSIRKYSNEVKQFDIEEIEKMFYAILTENEVNL
jgi:hypothetical protein